MAAAQSVLIVDDNPFIRSALCSFLRSHRGFSVVAVAASGTEAITAAKRYMPNLVLMDLAMPGLNGIEASSIIKDAQPFTHIFLFTLHGDTLGDVVRAAGVDAVIAKDKGIAGLTDALETFLANRVLS